MPAAPLPPDEAERLEALHALDILGADTDGLFDRVAGLAATLFDGPFGAVVLIDADTLHYKGASGLDFRSFPRALAFSAYALSSADGIWFEDVATDRRVADLVPTSPLPIRFYAAAPIVVNGFAVGALCVGCHNRRAYDAALASSLQDMAALVSDTLAVRAARRALEQALAAKSEAERISRLQTEHGPMALIMLDRDLCCIMANARWHADMQGASQPQGRSLYELLPAAAAYAAQHQRALTGEVVKGEAALAMKDGSLRHRRYEMVPWRDEDGQIGGIVIGSCDISDIATARETTERSENRLTLALEMSGDGVWELDVVNRRLFATGPAIALLGTDLSYATVSEAIFDRCHPDDRPWVDRAWRRHLETGAPYNVEHRLARDDGSVVWLHAFAEAVRGPDGQVERIVGAIRNISDHKQAELELADAIRAAEAANFAKSEFLANMSHELRTPLNGVTGVISALSRTPLNAHQAEMVGLIETSADSLGRLLSDVLDLARVDSGKLELNAEGFELAPFIQGVATLFQWRAKDKGVDFAYAIAPGVGDRYTADAVRLRQILSNLLSNAVKFTAAGFVRLSVEPGAKQGELAFVVRDTGIGFSPEQGERIFERFSQGDGSITRRFGGSGLGLAISRALARKMGGRLEAHGQPDLGATFTLTLPLTLAESVEPARPSAPPAAPAPAPARGKVLLAEDHPINRKVVELILGAAGLELTSVENGEEALAALRREAFDIVLMDMQMPVMDGLTAIRALRAMEGGEDRRTPVISLTANALPEHVRASLEAGADEHMTKPISAAMLLDRVFGLMAPATEPALARAGG